MYPAAQATIEGRLLIEAMLGEHEVLTRLVREVADSDRRAARRRVRCGAAGGLRLPPDQGERPGGAAAGRDPGRLVGRAARWHAPAARRGGRDRRPRARTASVTGCGGHTCACGEVDGPGYPELDVRSVPHAIRHATIFGALESVRPGAGLELVAPHDPLPLLDQVNRRWPGRFSVAYRERGPEAWRLSLVRTDA